MHGSILKFSFKGVAHKPFSFMSEDKKNILDYYYILNYKSYTYPIIIWCKFVINTLIINCTITIIRV